ncbi:MAG: hypothetical protein KKH20_00870 [Proteobacteria bacterium]|nr:hypothetical protein [Pseudomonadota bacterium]MCG2829623.1 hypothetical protein [Desulfobacteraceae bacterium]
MINHLILPVNRIISSLLLCWIILLFAVGTAYSFYRISDGTEKLFFHREKSRATWNKDEKHFVVYDNFNHFSAKKNNKPIICSGSNDFVPADIINFNIPVDISIKRSITPDNLLANLIYTNLKLKKLLEEYEELQKRAKKLLAELKVPFLDKENSVYNEKQNLEQKYQGVIRELNSSAQLYGDANLPVINSTKFLPFLLSKQKMSGSSEPLELFAYFNEEAKAGPVDPVITPEYNYGKRLRTSFDEDTSLPWIFRILLNVVSYIMLHKIEALLLFSVLMVIIILLSVLRHR